MKIIDLLVKISKGEEVPKEIMFDTDRYYLNNNNHYVRECGDFIQRLDIEYNLVGCLNDEVEIIEEEKEIEISKMIINEEFLFSNSHSRNMRREDRRLLDNSFKEVSNKINELIDVINDMRDKE